MQMNLSDAVVIEADGLAEGILCNFQPAIQIAPQSRLKIKAERQAQGMSPEATKKIGAMRGLANDALEMIGHGGFILSSF